jgi:hypothetical protein
MRASYCTIALVLLAACGDGTYDSGFELKHFTFETTLDLPHDQLEDAIELVYQEFKNVGLRSGILRKAAWMTTIFVEDHPIDCRAKTSDGRVVPCFGLYRPYYTIQLWWNNPCVGLTAFPHELIHWGLDHNDQDPDRDHNDLRYYGEGSMTHRINLELIDRYCPEFNAMPHNE